MSSVNVFQLSPVRSQERLRLVIRGGVQGVGFRPFVYRLATEMKLTGRVQNSAEGVLIEVEGARSDLEFFLLRIEREKPPRASIYSLEPSFLDPAGFSRFEILPSVSGTKTAFVLPDIATCEACLSEILDPGNRRYLYPFTNCTNCGPRFSIMESLPYDRENTTMKKFMMCGQCQAEYTDPENRRFHAQPNACPVCGPYVEWWGADGQIITSHNAALEETVRSVRSGKIVAVKGLGGFHLMVDATNEQAVLRLRARKHREEKPFALMYPNLEMVKTDCFVSLLEERLLRSPEAPITLLQRRKQFLKTKLAFEAIAPRNPDLGVMLPYTPLHHLLLLKLSLPVVATSGNLSEEPMMTDEKEALKRLDGIADFFLVHNRPIRNHADDSIVRIAAGRELVLRRARGFAPLPIHVRSTQTSVLGVGAHLKNTVAQSVGGHVFVSQHIGDLENEKTYQVFKQTIQSFGEFYGRKPDVIATDLHPGYFSTQFAKASGERTVQIQHHYAHILACMAENDLEGPVLGVAWDGTGYGTDGTIWGGEFLTATRAGYLRAGHLRTFRLPGGEEAIRQPRRSALGLLYEISGDRVFSTEDILPLASFSLRELSVIKTMLTKKIQSPQTSSAGRLFDAVAALLGIRQVHHFEGQAAMELEYALDGYATEEIYPIRIDARAGSELILDWEAMILEILADQKSAVPAGLISVKFHNTLAEGISLMAERLGEKQVALSGGCFQNRYLLERSITRLKAKGFRPYWPQRIPPNDGGIAVGQVVGVTGGRASACA